MDFKDFGLDVTLILNFLSEEELAELHTGIKSDVKWSRPLSNTRRTNQTYGDDGLVYRIEWYGKVTERKVYPWLSCFKTARDKIEKISGEVPTICVLQHYPAGVGINPHRDKEMVRGTTIFGLSLLGERTLTLSRGSKKYDIVLPTNSLYILKPPTNDYWAHAIEIDNTERISLTFRTYKS